MNEQVEKWCKYLTSESLDRTRFLMENQLNSCTPDWDSYDSAIFRAIRKIYGESFLFRVLTGFELLSPSDPVENTPLKTECFMNWQNFFEKPKTELTEDEKLEVELVFAHGLELEFEKMVLEDIRGNIGVELTFDMATAPGDTLKEKYESLYLKILEVSNIISEKTGSPLEDYWLVMHREWDHIFFSRRAGFAPSPSDTFCSQLTFTYSGPLNNRWRVYCGHNTPEDEILVGCRGGIVYGSHTPFTSKSDGKKIETILQQTKKIVSKDYFARIKLLNMPK